MKDHDQAACFNVVVENMIRGCEGQDACRRDHGADFEALIDLAGKLMRVDLSGESLVRASLRSRLLAKTRKENAVRPEQATWLEMDDSELAAVSGGMDKEDGRTGCNLCGCTQPAGSIHGQSCPVCRHPRGVHS